MEPVPESLPEPPTPPPPATEPPAGGSRFLNSHTISLITLVIGVFFSGAYIRGESARKLEIKQEIDAIRARQTEILGAVAEINRVAAEKDSLLLGRIRSARTYIERLDRKEAFSEQEIQAFGREINQLQGGIDSTMAAIGSSGSFSTQPVAPALVPAGQ